MTWAETTGGDFVCWGYNWNSKCSLPQGDFVQVNSGYHHACGLKSDNKVACWGFQEHIGSPLSLDFQLVVAGFQSTCALDLSGSPHCWGRDDFGQISNAPTGSYTQLAVGSTVACVLDADGYPTCWGMPDAIADTPTGTRFDHLSTFGSLVCGVRIEGGIACWGADDESNVLQVPAELAR